MPLHLTPSLSYDRAAILRAAWAMARHEVVIAARSIGHLKGYITTARAEFAACLRRVWANAKELRSIALWKVEQAAGAETEAARCAALPIRDRQIEDARTALMFAEHNDTDGAHRLIAAAHARLASLQLHA